LTKGVTLHTILSEIKHAGGIIMNRHDEAFYIGKSIKETLEIPDGLVFILMNHLKANQITDVKGEILELFIAAKKRVPQDFFLNLDAETGYCFVAGLRAK